MVSAVAISTVEFTCNNRESAIRSPLLSELSMQKVNILKVLFFFFHSMGKYSCLVSEETVVLLCSGGTTR